MEHTAQHPNSRPVVETLDLHKPGRIGCGSLPLVDPAGIEPASKNLFLSASPSADNCLCFPYMTDKYQTVILGSSCFMTIGGTPDCSRSPLNDALRKAAVLFGRTAA